MCFNELCGENDILTYNLQILLHIGILIIWKSCTTVIDLLHKKKFNSILFGAVLILVVKDLVEKKTPQLCYNQEKRVCYDFYIYTEHLNRQELFLIPVWSKRKKKKESILLLHQWLQYNRPYLENAHIAITVKNNRG